MYLVNKMQFRLDLYFDLFDFENFRLGSQKRHLTPLSLLLLLLCKNLQTKSLQIELDKVRA